MRFRYAHPDVVADADGCCSAEDIFYHAVRCSLLHNGDLPANLKFEDRGMIIVNDEGLTLPSRLIYGLIIAIIACPVNATEVLSENLFLETEFGLFVIHEYWGQRDKVLRFFAVDPG